MDITFTDLFLSFVHLLLHSIMKGKVFGGGFIFSSLCGFSSCKLFLMLSDGSLLLEDPMMLTKEQAAAIKASIEIVEEQTASFKSFQLSFARA